MKILICDDDDRYTADICGMVSKYLAERGLACEIDVLRDPLDAAGGNSFYEIAFLDIQMPGMDGITLAQRLKERNRKIALFFITNYDEYQDSAMDLQAFRFFEKPVDPQRLRSGLDKAMEYIDGACVDIYLKADSAQQRILADDILYVTRQDRKSSVVTAGASLLAADKFDDLCSRLPKSFFFPVHKSFFVNLHYVNRYAYSEIQLTDGTLIPVAPRRQAEFHKFWFAYLRRR